MDDIDWKAIDRETAAHETDKQRTIDALVAALERAQGRLRWAASANPGVSRGGGKTLVRGWADEIDAALALARGGK